jgi:hypothetical protein
MRITLIQCTDTKRDESAVAKDLYDESRYFRKMRAWARAKRQPWFILSAKHGLVSPHQQLDSYDERGLSEQQAREIADALHRMAVGTVDVTAGRDYTDPLVPELERQGIDVINHFAGEKIGKREQLLAEAAHELRNRG